MIKTGGVLPGIKTEIVAGVTTFVTMAYIIAVNPSILSNSGMPVSDVFFATCVSAAIATLIMGLYARYPFALAPGMGINAFFAFTVCGQMGLSWQAALACFLVSGIAFFVLSVLGLREKFVSSIPAELVRSVSAGIGLFIAFIGLQHAKIVVAHPTTMLTLGNLTSPETVVALIGLVTTAILVSARIPGAVLFGIIVTVGISFLSNIAPLPNSIAQVPSLPSQTMGAAFFALGEIFRPEILPVLFTMLFMDLFDTMGTLLALGYASGRVEKNGNFPRVGRAFTSDSIGTIIGSILGTSAVTTYIESASGIAVGGRDGRTAVVTAILFLAALFFFPVVAAIPDYAVAPTLIIVGAMMTGGLADINWKDYTVAIPALGVILIMPATYSISNGLGAGFILYVITHVAARRYRELSPIVYIIAAAFCIYFFR